MSVQTSDAMCAVAQQDLKGIIYHNHKNRILQNTSPMKLIIILAHDIQGVFEHHPIPLGQTTCTPLQLISAVPFASCS
jgi:hypothetical protein